LFIRISAIILWAENRWVVSSQLLCHAKGSTMIKHVNLNCWQSDQIWKAALFIFMVILSTTTQYCPRVSNVFWLYKFDKSLITQRKDRPIWKWIWCLLRILQTFVAHRTTLNGNSFKHSRITTKCKNFDLKTNVIKPMALRKAAEFVSTASASYHIVAIANSCCWQWRRPHRDTMYTHMANINTTTNISTKVSEEAFVKKLLLNHIPYFL
jgi:hypothetical protein